MLCRGQSQHCTVNPSEDWGNGDTQRRGEEMTLMVWSRQCRSSPSTLGNATFPTLWSAFIIKTVPPHTLKISGGKRKAGQICDIDFFSIHWLEFKFKVENYSPWGRRNLSVGGTNTKSSRIGVLLFLSDSACNQSCHIICSTPPPALSLLGSELYAARLWGFFCWPGVLVWLILCGDISTFISRAMRMFRMWGESQETG